MGLSAIFFWKLLNEADIVIGIVLSINIWKHRSCLKPRILGIYLSNVLDELDIFLYQLNGNINCSWFTLFTNYNWSRWVRCYFLRVICVEEFSHGVLLSGISQRWMLLIRIHLMLHSLIEELLTYRQPLLCLQHFGMGFLSCQLFPGNRHNLGPMRFKLHVLCVLDLLNPYIALIKPIIHLGYLQPKSLFIVAIILL